MKNWTKDTVSEKYKLYGKMLYRTCIVYLKNRYDAEDAVQETFYKLMLNSKNFTDPLYERKWLFCVTKNICKNMLKSKHRSQVTYDDTLAMSTENNTDNEILNLVNALKDKYRDVVLLYYFEGSDVNETAMTLGISVSAVKMRLKRARELLKIELEE